MFDDILKNLNTADAKDFLDCLRENLSDSQIGTRYKMFMEIKYKDPAQWNILTTGCKAAAEVFMKLVELGSMVEF